MLLTTTNTLEGRRISEYLGLVSGEAILGANIFKDFFASIPAHMSSRDKFIMNKLGTRRLYFVSVILLAIGVAVAVLAAVMGLVDLPF